VTDATARSFDSLTPRGQTQRLAALARVALQQYGLGDARVSLLKRTFNTMFRIVGPGGTKYALRVGARERIHTDETEAVETAWLTALRAETDVDVALPVTTRAGSPVTRVHAAGVPEARACVLFEWARGRRLGELLDGGGSDRALVHDAGALLARLHEHGATFEGGAKQPVIVADNVISFRLPDLIPRVDADYGTLFAEAFDRAQAAIDALWARPPHPAHLLHGDFHPNNILVWRNRLTPIDFQDALWGFEIQDISMTIAAFEHSPDPEGLAAALRAGYERVRPWPAHDAEMLGTLIAARHLSMLNIGYNLRRPGFERFVAAHAEWLREWMASLG
jgi:Ser/Thr protein kinase RdoA (MazF antagonist)